VHPSKFVTALDNIKVFFTKEVLEELLNYYRISDLQVDYIKLCQHIDEL